jgi:hypothetical protein
LNENKYRIPDAEKFFKPKILLGMGEYWLFSSPSRQLSYGFEAVEVRVTAQGVVYSFVL